MSFRDKLTELVNEYYSEESMTQREMEEELKTQQWKEELFS